MLRGAVSRLCRPGFLARTGPVSTAAGYDVTVRRDVTRGYNTQAWRANREARLRLAASYRLFEQLNMHEGVCNHLTVMAPAQSGDGDVMLLVPYGLYWSEVTASSLLGVRPDTEQVVEGDGAPEGTAVCIHLGLRDVTPHTCVYHLHPPYSTALGCLADPRLLMCHQNSARFHQQVAYDAEYDGHATQRQEGRRLGRQLADKEVLFMCNHGVIAAAQTPAIAFDQLYYLERAAMYQVLAQSTGKDMQMLSDHILSQTRQDFDKNNRHMLHFYADAHFNARYRILQKHHPEFQN